MPTGYTAKVSDGTITEFADYALACARQFGACILMRDEPSDAKIPDEFKPSDHHISSLEKARARLAILDAMTTEECEQEAQLAHSARLKSRQEQLERYATIRQRYEAMLTKARQFKPPTPEHENYAKFIVSQLEESMRFDCHEDTLDKPPKLETAEEWKRRETESVMWDIDYHTRHHKEEVERTEGRNDWIRKLRKAIAEVE